MMRLFDQEGNPISPTTWALMLEDSEHRIIEQIWIGDVTVSTVWLGMDQSFGHGSEPALIFETMVFGGEHGLHPWEQGGGDGAAGGGGQVGGDVMDSDEVLLAARDLIREHGWTRGVLEDGHGRMCIRGAVIKAVTGCSKVVPHDVRAYRPGRKYLRLLDLYSEQEHGIFVVSLNDDKFVHEDEACDFLEQAAKWAANRR